MLSNREAILRKKISEGEFDNAISKVVGSSRQESDCKKVGYFNNIIISEIKEKLKIKNNEDAKKLYIEVAEDLEKRCLKIVNRKDNSANFYNKGGLLSSAVYFALYETYGSEATEYMYKMLEDITVKALSGDSNSINFLHMFYSITTDANIEEQIAVLKQLTENNKEIFKKVDMNKLKLFLCARNDGYSVTNGKSESKECEALFEGIIMKVISDG